MCNTAAVLQCFLWTALSTPSIHPADTMPSPQKSAGSAHGIPPRLPCTGLYRSFDAGTIYCSAVTANLLQYDMRMPPERIHRLPMDEPVTIDGVTITLMTANHCPGAVMMLFQVPQPGSSKVQVGSHAR